MTNATHPNLSIMEKLDIQNLDECTELFADDFVWHYVNSKLPKLEGDYQGASGLKDFFSKLSETGSGTFRVNPIDVRAVGDELVVVQVCNQMAFDGNMIEFDAVVLWRIVDGKLAEAWDIPAINAVRPVQSQGEADLVTANERK